MLPKQDIITENMVVVSLSLKVVLLKTFPRVDLCNCLLGSVTWYHSNFCEIQNNQRRRGYS